MTEPRNLKRWQIVNEFNERIAIPFDCSACGVPECASYGKDGAWYCTECWQVINDKR